MEKSYLDYAMSVIVARALPDARDGMKPVHRRILYSMHRSGITHNSPYKKSARIVGDVLGKYHPHGDSSVYMAMARLAQDFNMRYPLVDGQGNFGSVDGDSPAAMRYTEARLAKISNEILADIDKDTVPMIDNFDGSLKEPAVLPGKIPNLLLMGSEGIAVGMATKIPPHNLTEVCQAIIATIKNGHIENAQTIDISNLAKPTDKDSLKANQELISTAIAKPSKEIAGKFISDITFEEIMSYIQGPDFPTGAIIFDKKAIDEAYQTGRGRIIVRAKTEIVEAKKGGWQIVATEIPYQVNKAKLLEKIGELVKAKKIIGIRDANDHSDRKGLTITIDLKKDAQPKVVLNKLFKLTEFQASFPINMVALTSEGVPQLMNIKQILREYVIHRQQVIIRRAQFDLIKARDRAHILEGLIIALNNLDEIIKLIRASYDDAKERLMERFGLSEIQAQAILDMRLARLQGLEREKIENEYQQLQEMIHQYLTLLSDPQAVLNVLVRETEEMIENYGDKRRTKLVKGKVGEFSDEDLIADVSTIITLTRTGYVKRISPDVFRAQSRGGKGVVGVKMKEEDTVKCILSVNTHDELLLFTNFGRVFKLKAHEIPESSKTAKGSAIVNLINLKPDEKVETILKFDFEADKKNFISLVTRQGLVKKTAVKQYDNIRQNGIIAIDLNKGDELVWGQITTGTDDILLVTYQGKSIRFSEKEVKPSSRDTKGVKGITLKSGDYVTDAEVIFATNADKKEFLLTVTEGGMGKMSKISDYPLQKRSGSGLKVAEINSKTGNIVKAFLVNETHEALIITTNEGQTIKLEIDMKSIPVLSRSTQGVILIRLNGNDRVATATLLSKVDEKEAETVAA
ncbi:MAG: DNA gyrase subunit A [bacterium]|nr:DNA gyrase subunit A [bacterium]